MKDENQIELAIRKIMDMDSSKYRSMTYQEGLREALEWVLGELDDSEFEPLLND